MLVFLVKYTTILGRHSVCFLVSKKKEIVLIALHNDIKPILFDKKSWFWRHVVVAKQLFRFFGKIENALSGCRQKSLISRKKLKCWVFLVFLKFFNVFAFESVGSNSFITIISFKRHSLHVLISWFWHRAIWPFAKVWWWFKSIFQRSQNRVQGGP